MHQLPDATRTRTLTTDELRSGFLIQGLFEPGQVNLQHIDLDRAVLGGAVPGAKALTLESPDG